jgi:hypothetical protein
MADGLSSWEPAWTSARDYDTEYSLGPERMEAAWRDGVYVRFY